MSNPVYEADRAIQSASQSATLQQNELLRAVDRTFNWWGGPGVVYFVAVLWLGGRAIKRSRAALIGLRCAESLAVSSALSGILKGLVARARPFVTPGEPWHWHMLNSWTDAHNQSMPSGHTTAATAFASALCVASVRYPKAARGAMIAAAIATVPLVGFARIYSDQHWLTDVLAGALLGATTGILLTRWHERHPRTAFDRVMLGADRAP